jgi:NifU-like protein involved in Fe-S cluster formation
MLVMLGGNNHDFKITTDFERPNIVRVVDMRYQESTNLKQEDIIELNIQSNDSIVRDFSFNTSIPSAMSATISTAAQAPKNVDSLEAASFGAFHKNISNRFATFSEPEDPTGLTEQEKTILDAKF